MTYDEKRKAKRLQLEKDNRYLLKQLSKLTTNKSEILIRIKTYRKKYNKRDKTNPIHIKRLVKLLGVNQRTIYLLVSIDFLHLDFPYCITMLDSIEVELFIKSLQD